MMVKEELAHVGSVAPVSQAPETLIAWESQSCDELRAIASRGVHGGELYFAAVKELERRAHDTETALEARQAESFAQRQHQIWWVALLIAALAVAAIARGVIGL